MWLFMTGQLLTAGPIMAIFLGKAAICHRSLNRHRVDSAKWTWLDFSFSLKCFFLKKLQQKSRRMRKMWCQWRTTVGRRRMFHWALQRWLRQFEKVLNFSVSQVLSYSSGNQLLYTEVQYMFTLDLICMWYPCVSVIHQTVTGTTGPLTCLLLFQCMCVHTFAFIYSIRLNGCLFHWGGLGPLFFFIQEGPWAPF